MMLCLRLRIYLGMRFYLWVRFFPAGEGLLKVRFYLREQSRLQRWILGVGLGI